MFLEDTERVIIMQDALAPFLPEEMPMLADAGIKTVLLQGLVRWDDMQPSPDAPIDWRRVDGDVKKCVDAGLKVLLPNLYTCPAWKPDEWFMARGKYGIPSMTNPQAAADIDEWTARLIDRYTSDMVQVVYSVPCNGEFPDADWPTTKHPIPNDVITEFIAGRMGQIADQHGEVWTFLHHYGNPPYLDDVFDRLVNTWPNYRHYNVQYTHFIHTWGGQAQAVRRMREKWGITPFGGSEYCAGMIGYLNQAIADDIGFLTCPNHSFQPERRLTPEMLGIIRDTVIKLEAAHV